MDLRIQSRKYNKRFRDGDSDATDYKKRRKNMRDLYHFYGFFAVHLLLSCMAILFPDHPNLKSLFQIVL